MKLLHCTACGDVRALRPGAWSVCWCGRSRGRYLDDQEAVIEGRDALALGISNSSLSAAVEREIEDWEGLTRRYHGHRFDAFVIPWNTRSVKRRPGPADADDKERRDVSAPTGL